MEVDAILGNLVANLIWVVLLFVLGVVIATLRGVSLIDLWKIRGHWTGYHLTKDGKAAISSSLEIGLGPLGLRAKWIENEYVFSGSVKKLDGVIYLTLSKELIKRDHVHFIAIKPDSKMQCMTGILTGANQDHIPSASYILFSKETITNPQIIRKKLPDGKTFLTLRK